MKEKIEEGATFLISGVPAFQTANKAANAKGLRARLDGIGWDSKAQEKLFNGTWVKNETPTERP